MVSFGGVPVTSDPILNGLLRYRSVWLEGGDIDVDAFIDMETGAVIADDPDLDSLRVVMFVANDDCDGLRFAKGDVWCTSTIGAEPEGVWFVASSLAIAKNGISGIETFEEVEIVNSTDPRPDYNELSASPYSLIEIGDESYGYLIPVENDDGYELCYKGKKYVECFAISGITGDYSHEIIVIDGTVYAPSLRYAVDNVIIPNYNGYSEYEFGDIGGGIYREFCWRIIVEYMNEV